MERALTQVDILRHIVSHIPVCLGFTLASLACVSQLVSQVALDKLWSVPPSVVVLARCMPREYWDELEVETRVPGKGYTMHTSQLTLSDRTRVGDWLGQRFRAYAARIRELQTLDHVADRAKCPIRTPVPPNPTASATNADILPPTRRTPIIITTSKLHQDVLLAWASYSRDIKILFPNLRHLFWRVRDTNDRHLIPALLGPSCTNLRVSTNGQLPVYAPGRPAPFDAGTLAVMLEKTFKLCPMLCGLQLEIDAGSMADIDVIMTLPFQQLRSFEINFTIGTMSTDFARFAATWPHLQTFSGTLGSYVTFPKSLPRIFPELRELRIGTSTLEHMHCILLAIQSAYLHSLRLEFHQDYELSPGNFVDTLQLIAQCPFALSLTSLDFSYSYSISMNDAPIPNTLETPKTITFDRIKPGILGLRNLKALVVDREMRYPEILPSPAIQFMLQTWTHLRLLIINTDKPESMPINNFVALVRERPFLERIDGLEVEYSVGSAAPYPFDGWQHSCLVNIIFRAKEPGSPTADRIPMAHFLSSTFPRVVSRLIQGDGAMRMFVFRAARAREFGHTWGLDDYQRVLSTNHSPQDSVPDSTPQHFTGHYTEEGRPILCYAEVISNWDTKDPGDERALRIRTGDIVAITKKHENGSWTGVLLDDKDYEPGKDTFPCDAVVEMP